MLTFPGENGSDSVRIEKQVRQEKDTTVVFSMEGPLGGVHVRCKLQ